MTITQALRRGVRTVNGAKRLWFLFYAVNTLTAALVAAALMSVPFHSLGDSAWAQQMVGNLDLQWISELAAIHGSLPTLPIVAAACGVFALAAIVYLFLLGGVLQICWARQPFVMRDFFAACGKHFWRLLRLAIYSAIFYGFALLVGRLLAAAGQKIWGEGSEATPLVYWSWFRMTVLVCLLGFVSLVFDYARIRLVAEDSRRAFRVALGSFRFVWRNLGRTVGLYVALSAVTLLVMGAYFGVSLAIPQTTAATVLLLLLVRQVTVIARIWSRLLCYAGQCEMYDALKPPPAPEPERLPEPEIIPEPDAGTEPPVEVIAATEAPETPSPDPAGAP